MGIGQIYNLVLYQPIVNILLLLYYVFSALKIPGAFGFSIIMLTALVRLAMQPFYGHQMTMSEKMTKIKPHLDTLSKKHKDDKKKLQEEQLKLYKEMGINPATGCLLALLQIPIFIALYQVLNLFLQNGKTSYAVVAKQINTLTYFGFLKIGIIDPWFFGFNLAIAPNQFGKYGYHYLIIPVITGILQYYQIKASTPVSPTPEPEKNKSKEKNNNPSKEPTGEDFQKAMSSQMKIMFPLMIGYFAFILPVGLAIYWNIFSIFTLLQKRQQDKNSQNIKSKFESQIPKQ